MPSLHVQQPPLTSYTPLPLAFLAPATQASLLFPEHARSFLPQDLCICYSLSWNALPQISHGWLLPIIRVSAHMSPLQRGLSVNCTKSSSQGSAALCYTAPFPILKLSSFICYWFYCKGQDNKYFRLSGPCFPTTTQLFCCNTRADLDNK